MGTSDRIEQRQAIAGFNRQQEVVLLGGAISPQQQFAANRINNQLNPSIPGIQTNFTDFEEFRNQQLEKFGEAGVNIPQIDATAIILNKLDGTIEKLNKMVGDKLSKPQSVAQEIQITNTFTGTDKNAADTITQQIRKQLIDLGTELNR